MGRTIVNNNYIDFGNIYAIVDNKGNRAYIDKEDLNKVVDYYFYKLNNGYFITRSGGKSILLHKLICNSGGIVDHINRCKLDNRKCNLRACSQKQNCYNQKIRSTNKTGYIGISYDNKRKKFVATIGKKRIGRYGTIEEAVKAREEHEKCLAIT